MLRNGSGRCAVAFCRRSERVPKCHNRYSGGAATGSVDCWARRPGGIAAPMPCAAAGASPRGRGGGGFRCRARAWAPVASTGHAGGRRGAGDRPTTASTSHALVWQRRRSRLAGIGRSFDPEGLPRKSDAPARCWAGAECPAPGDGVVLDTVREADRSARGVGAGTQDDDGAKARARAAPHRQRRRFGEHWMALWTMRSGRALSSFRGLRYRSASASY
jgi:hypothetical protein